MLHIGRQHLQRAFNQHLLKAADAQTVSEMLLLVYAVECGLKYHLLVKRGCNFTSKLEKDDLTHDLEELQKKLGLPPDIGNYTLDEPSGEPVRPDAIHQVFRYGARMNSIDFTALRGKLQKLVDWSKDQGI